MKDHLIWNEFGNIYLKTASFDEAIEAYSKAIEMDPDFGWPYRNLASAYLSKGHTAEAVPLLLRSIELLQSNAEKAISFNKLGDAYRQLGDYQQALEAYQQADALSNNGHARTSVEPADAYEADVLDATPTDPPAESMIADTPEPEASVTIEDESTPAVAPFTDDLELDGGAFMVEDSPEDQAPEVAEEASFERLVAEDAAPDTEAEVDFESPLQPEEVPVADPGTESELVEAMPVQESIDDPSIPEADGDPVEVRAVEETNEAAMDVGELSPTSEKQADLYEDGLDVVLSSKEAKTEEPAAPFALEANSSVSQDMSSPMFDVSVASGAKSGTSIQTVDLELEEPELPEWLREPAVSSDESEDLSAFGIWEPLEVDEKHHGSEERKFKFIELHGESILEEQEANQEGELRSEDETSSGFDPEPLQASSQSDTADTAPDEEMPVEQAGREEDLEADSSQKESLAHEVVEEDTFVEGDQEPTEAVVDTTGQGAFDATDMLQKTEEDLQQSISIYQKITDVNPTNDRAWHTLAELYKSTNQFSQAATAYEKAISLNPDRDIYHYHLGLVYTTLQKHSEASRCFQKVLIINPEHILAHCALAGSYRRLGLEDEALEHLSIVEPVIQSETEYNRACFYAISENPDEAFKYLEIALQKHQTSLDWVQRDPDLDNLRSDPRFMATIVTQEFPGQS